MDKSIEWHLEHKRLGFYDPIAELYEELQAKAQLYEEDATFNAENVEPNATQDVQSVGSVGDYISRQAAIDVIDERLIANGYTNTALVSELNRLVGIVKRLPSAEPQIVRCIARFPSADVRENRHGHWIKDGQYQYRCSNCGEHIQGDADATPDINKFCWNCGSEMEGTQYAP